MRPALSSRLGPAVAGILATADRSFQSRAVSATLAGLVPAMPLWIPAGVLIGAAALLLGQSSDGHAAVADSRRNLLRTTGVTTRTPAAGEA